MAVLGKYNYYEVLEVQPNAPQHAVTTAYERAKRTYSGENPAIYTIFSEAEARELLTMIEEAYSVLGNKALRMIYDQRIANGFGHLNDLSYASILEASKQHFPEQGNKALLKISYQKNDEFEQEIQNQTQWDGDFLKKVREYKNVTIEKLSEITKISSYYLRAVEDMNAQGLPAIVFVRGYVIQMARALNLDDKLVADSYMQSFKRHNKI
ncbi:MAG: helix-turn-helix domain-containing protein [Bdellovibrionia bacterium]